MICLNFLIPVKWVAGVFLLSLSHMSLSLMTKYEKDFFFSHKPGDSM